MNIDVTIRFTVDTEGYVPPDQDPGSKQVRLLAAEAIVNVVRANLPSVVDDQVMSP